MRGSSSSSGAGVDGGWRPVATREVLEARARMLRGIRAFFHRRDVLEVETPAISPTAVTDPAIHSIEVTLADETMYLHTSPEFSMKRMLVSGSGDIFQVCKVFRAGESGRYHSPEFSMLEWYRLGFDHHRLADEVVELIRCLAPAGLLSAKTEKISYQDLFLASLGIDPHASDVGQLEALARRKNIHPGCSMGYDAWLDLLLSHCLLPVLPRDCLTVVFDFPVGQAALARLDNDHFTAARFEVFWGPLELANGYYELSDADEQRKRFEADLEIRRSTGRPGVPIDESLLHALAAGMPDCAGVAIGLDRLLMRLVGAESISEVLTFPLAAGIDFVGG